MTADKNPPLNPEDEYSPKIRTGLSEAFFGHEDHPDVQALHEQMNSAQPNHDVIVEIAERLHIDPVIGAKMSLWWHDPKTQSFIAELNGTGL